MGVRMLRFYFGLLKIPNCTKKFEPPDLSFWRYGVKGLTFPSFPQKLGVCPLHNLYNLHNLYHRNDPQNPDNFVKVSWPVCEIFGIFHFTKVSYTLITESLYSDEYSFTFSVSGVDRLNSPPPLPSSWERSIQPYIIYYIHIYSIQFSNTWSLMASWRSASVCWCVISCLHQQSLWRHDNALNDTCHSDASTFSPPPQKLGGQIPSILCTGYPRDDPKKPW